MSHVFFSLGWKKNTWAENILQFNSTDGTYPTIASVLLTSSHMLVSSTKLLWDLAAHLSHRHNQDFPVTMSS